MSKARAIRPVLAIIAAGVAGGALAGYGLLSAVGFTAGGVVEDSIAAVWQSSIGNVIAGSWFAAFQTAAATGTVWAWGGAIGGAISSVAAALVRFTRFR